MNQISFQPAFDVFHTEFRILRLRHFLGSPKVWHYDQLRIADFYLLFFFRLGSARLSNEHRAIKNLARLAAANRYEHQPDDVLLFGRMRPIQNAAIRTLAANGYFEMDALADGEIRETEKVEPHALLQRIQTINASQQNVVKAIFDVVSSYDLLGPNGLKARTGLLEHRYDAV
jgi:hypothetical protein